MPFVKTKTTIRNEKTKENRIINYVVHAETLESAKVKAFVLVQSGLTPYDLILKIEAEEEEGEFVYGI